MTDQPDQKPVDEDFPKCPTCGAAAPSIKVIRDCRDVWHVGYVPKPVDEREQVKRFTDRINMVCRDSGHCKHSPCDISTDIDALILRLIEQRDEARRENRPYMITCPWCAADMRDTSNPRQVVHLIHCGDMRWESMKQERDAAMRKCEQYEASGSCIECADSFVYCEKHKPNSVHESVKP